MSANLENLATVLEEELYLAGRLLDLAKDARAAAVAADPVLLAQIVTEQEQRAAELEAAEVRRAAAAAEAAAELSLPAGEPARLRQIIERAAGAPAARLRRLGGRLRGVAADLRQATARNRELLESSLARVDEFFAAVAETRRGPAAYGPYGPLQPGAAAVMMDRKV